MNISLLLDMAVDGFGGRTIIGPLNGGLTPLRLRDYAICGARRLAEANSDSVVYLGLGGPAFTVALFSAALAGIPLVPVNYRLGAEQLGSLLRNHPGAFGIAEADQSAALVRTGIPVTTPTEWLASTVLGAESPVTSTMGDSEPADDVAVIIYTSGTTSAPKGVLLRHENLTSYVLATVDFAGADENAAALMSVPPYHIAAVSNVLTNLFAGRRVLTLDQFTPEAWLDLVRAEYVTNAMVVPTMLARIMDASDLDRDVPTLRTLAYGGAPMPRRVIEAALVAWPHVDFVNAYGLTETSSTVSILGPEDHRTAIESADPRVRDRLASVGKPVPGIEIEIRAEHDEAAGPRELGRVWIRGDQVSGQYAGLGSSLDQRGFFDSRDNGYMDEDGYLFITGRADDTIIRGAENIAPAEIEEVLLRHPDVADAVVVGVPDEEWGQRIEAVVVARSGAQLDLEALRETVRGALRTSKTPDRIVCWQEIPRTPLGKVVRRDVLEALVGGAAV